MNLAEIEGLVNDLEARVEKLRAPRPEQAIALELKALRLAIWALMLQIKKDTATINATLQEMIEALPGHH